MTRSELRAYIQRSLNDPSGVFLPPATANAVMEEAQEFLAEFGPPIIRRILLPMRAYWTYYRLSPFASDAMTPVRIYSAANTRLLDVRSQDWLDGYDVNWEVTTGNPHIWFPRGWDQFGIYPKPATDGGILRVDYWAWPQTMLHDDATPEFAEADHSTLSLYGVYDGLLRGNRVAAALRIWKDSMMALRGARWIRVDRTPDRTHQHGAGNGNGQLNS